MNILYHAILISMGQVLLFSVCGFGVARLLLPQRLHRYEMLLAPLFGFALIACVGYYSANAGLTMRQLLPMVLIAAVAFALIGFVVHRVQRHWLPSIPPLQELLPLVFLMGATWFISIAPVLNYGTLIPIGDNWDVEFYLPLADYLKDYSYLNLNQAPANPLRDLLLTDRLSSRAMGATYAQAMADLLVYRDAWDSWVPMLALLRTFTLAGLYILLREGLHIGSPSAFAGTALAGINSLLLWTTYNSFGMGLGGLALLPAALLCLVIALEERTGMTLIAAIVFLAGITCTYWPMLMAYGAASLGIGLAVMWDHRHKGWHIILARGLLVLIGGGIGGLLVHLRASVAFVGMFIMQTPSMGVTEFLSPLAILGVAPFSHRGLTASTTPETILAWLGMVAALFLLVSACWQHSKRRGVMIGMLTCSIAYLLGLRFVVGYPYGYVRGASYINTIILGIIGTGMFFPHSNNMGNPLGSLRPKGIPHIRLNEYVSLVLFLLLIGSSVFATYKTYHVYAQQPGVYRLQTVGMRAAAATLTHAGPVYVSPAPELRGPAMAAWAYTLKNHELLGITATGYRPFAYTKPGSAPAYALLHRNEDPHEYGLEDTALIWHDDQSALYAAPTNRLSWLSGRTSSYTESNLLADDTTYTRAQIGVGNYLEAQPGQPQTLNISNNLLMYDSFSTPSEQHTVSLAQSPSTDARLTLELASFISQTVQVSIGNQVRIWNMPAGTTIFSNQFDVPANRFSFVGKQDSLFLRWVGLESVEATQDDRNLQPEKNTMLLGYASEGTAEQVRTHIHIANPDYVLVRLAVEIYEDVSGYNVQPAHYAWALFPAPFEGEHQLVMDVQTPTMMFDTTPLHVQTGALRDGRFFAALWVYQGEQVQRVLPFLRFERREGKVMSIQPLNLNVAFTRLAEPTHTLNVTFGGGIGLQGFERDSRPLFPGEQIRVSLLWKALQMQRTPYLVFVQVVGEQDYKIAEWNGAAGGDWYPTTTWQPGQRIWQDIPLTIAQDAPPGTYRIIVGLFDPATGTRLPIQDGSDVLWLEDVTIQSQFAR